jgi:LytS/YehU family sensor histidine kinase
MFWLFNILVWSTLGVILFLILQPFNNSWSYTFVRTALFSGMGFLFTSLFHFLYRFILEKRASIAVVAAGTLLFCTLFGTAWIFGLELLTWKIYPETADVEVLKKFGAKASLNNSFVLLAWCVSYIGLNQWRAAKEQQQRALAAAALAKDAQLQLLRYQLNPHFLFNALNSIRRLIEEEPNTAKNMVTELSEFLRYSLQDVDRKSVPLEKELECVQNYLAVEKIRFEEKMSVRYSIEKSAHKILVPPFLLIPLVENAVKYGTRTSSVPLDIEITATRANGHLELSVYNTGAWVKASSNNGTGTGLANLSRRLKEIYPDRHFLEIGERNGRVHALLRITLPKKG